MPFFQTYNNSYYQELNIALKNIILKINSHEKFRDHLEQKRVRNVFRIQNIELELSQLRIEEALLTKEINAVTNFFAVLKNQPLMLFAKVEEELAVLQDWFDEHHPNAQPFAVRACFSIAHAKIAKIKNVFSNRDEIKTFLKEERIYSEKINRFEQIQIYLLSQLIWRLYNSFAKSSKQLAEGLKGVLQVLHIQENDDLPSPLEIYRADSFKKTLFSIPEEKGVMIVEFTEKDLFEKFDATFTISRDVKFTINEKSLLKLEKQILQNNIEILSFFSNTETIIKQLKQIIAKNSADFKLCSIIVKKLCRLCELRELPILTEMEQAEYEEIKTNLTNYVEIMPGYASLRKFLVGVLFGFGALTSSMLTLASFDTDLFEIKLTPSFENKIISLSALGANTLTSIGFFYSSRTKGLAQTVNHFLKEQPVADSSLQSSLLRG